MDEIWPKLFLEWTRESLLILVWRGKVVKWKFQKNHLCSSCSHLLIFETNIVKTFHWWKVYNLPLVFALNRLSLEVSNTRCNLFCKASFSLYLKKCNCSDEHINHEDLHAIISKLTNLWKHSMTLCTSAIQTSKNVNKNSRRECIFPQNYGISQYFTEISAFKCQDNLTR